MICFYNGNPSLFFSKISYNIRKIYIKNKYYNIHAKIFHFFRDKKEVQKKERYKNLNSFYKRHRIILWKGIHGILPPHFLPRSRSPLLIFFLLLHSFILLLLFLLSNPTSSSFSYSSFSPPPSSFLDVFKTFFFFFFLSLFFIFFLESLATK